MCDDPLPTLDVILKQSRYFEHLARILVINLAFRCYAHAHGIKLSSPVIWAKITRLQIDKKYNQCPLAP